MKYFDRLPAPDFLLQNADRWNRQWSELKSRNQSASFQWPVHEGQRINDKIRATLSEQTQAHCSYCDAFPMDLADDTIDHFQPKGKPAFYHLAYVWENLFLACAGCQKAKAGQFEEALLRPDSPTYSFHHFFIYDFNTHQIGPNPISTAKDQLRAEATIRIFKLNHPKRITLRRRAYKTWDPKSTVHDLGDFPFRFIFE